MNLACGKSPSFLEPFGLLSGECLALKSKIPLSEDTESMYLLPVCKLKSGWGGLIGFRVVQIGLVQWLAHLTPRFCVSTMPRSLFLAGFCCQGQQSGSL